MDKELKKFIKKTYPYWDSLPKDSKNKQNIIEAFEAGQSSAMDKWISVKDKYPPISKTLDRDDMVLVVFKGKTEVGFYSINIKKEKGWWINGHFIKKGVEWWQFKPEPPTKEK